MTGSFALLVLALQNQATLLELQATYNVASSASSYSSVKLAEVNRNVFALIEADKLRNPEEFLKASMIISDFRFKFSVSRVKHELCLAALAGGNTQACYEIKKTWDALIISTGRQQRIGSIAWPDVKYKVAPAPKSIRAVFLEPDKAIARSRTAVSEAEITKICAEDQAVREGDWSKLTMKQIEEFAKGDLKRKTRIIKLLQEGRVVTAEDFNRASLVMQHGSTWNDYNLAHELSICSLLLGRKEAAWLASATYDRMLVSAGYNQRFATQYSSDTGGHFTLDAYDTSAIGDVIRKAMRCPTLEEAKNRKW